MQKLSRNALSSAESFIRNSGRVLEQRLFDYHYNDGETDAVIEALADYQNEDGGFGHGLEPDIQTPASSARTTTVGFQTLREIGAPADHPVVESAIRYLIETYDADEQVWSIVPPEVDDAPHAPWWNYEGTREGFNRFALNPTAEALANLYDYGSKSAPSIIDSLSDVVLARVKAAPDRMEMHDFQCCIRLAETASLPAAIRAPLQEKLKAVAEACVEREPSEWGGYSLTPLGAVFGSGSFLLPAFEKEVGLNLDFEIDKQGEDGAWSPPWGWGNQYEDEWKSARVEWQSHLTMNMLRLLKDFDRIA